MLDHISLQVRDVDAASKFYTSVLKPLGVAEAVRLPQGDSPLVGLAGRDGRPQFWLGPYDTAAQGTAREVHIAFTAGSETEIQQVHAAALAVGAEILHPPQDWPGYHPGYYAVFIRDLDGNNIEAVWHGF